MPGPLDYLKSAWQTANTPLLPKSAIQPAQDMLTEPSVDQSPMMARIKGFGAGALDGIRNLSTPLSVGSLALGMGGEGAAAGEAASAAPSVASGITDMMPVIEEGGMAAKQIAPSSAGADAYIGQLRKALQQVPTSKALPQTSQSMEGLGALGPEYVPRGAEEAFNAMRPKPQLPDPATLTQRNQLASWGAR